ncbi:ABC transporter ATP-binding protein [Bradyrhizobium prioriisuperbiae]|uniref:ABC transporter ATP-binding protein n=1 Tax=Bradyrhizobium prioriisuperbiae TaxID=2854389 RepID=UPI0028EC863A|nr:ABC transporter ATP-binding protein [Bradyrhizobium prioritasuperba]
MTALLEARKLSIGYGATRIAAGLDLSLAAGTVTCLLGPNGIGKTTLFKTLLGLIPPLAGSVQIDGKNLEQLDRQAIARQVAYVPQARPPEFAYTVRDLVVMGRTAYLGPFGVPGPRDHDAATTALETLGIAALAERDSTRISGGQQQLALIARALAQEAHVIVMDEPTASLDIGNRSLVLDTVRRLARSGLAVVLSTHDPEHAFVVADHVAILGRNDRFITGPVETVMTSQELSQLYGLALRVEQTPSGRHVVGPDRTEMAPPAV